MGHKRSIIIGLALVLGQTAGAAAADLGYSPMEPPPPPCCASAWYLKGFLGMTSYDVDKITNDQFKTADFTIFDTGFEGSGLAGLGLGYQFNNWLRFDVTSEYRNRSTFHGLDRYINSPVPPPGNTFGTDQYTATLKSWVSLANVYWDIGCWKGITPYVGGGVGFAKNWIGDYTDINVPNLGVAFANTHSDGSFAWAIDAGLSYDVTQNFTIDLAYRYLDIGDAQSGKVHTYLGGSFPATGFDNIHSSDIMLAARYKFGCCGAQASMPVSYK
jgi:opacity protein-like surface antigen